MTDPEYPAADLCQAAFFPIIYLFYPETSNISLEDIDKLFLPAEMQDYAERHNSIEGQTGPDSGKVEAVNEVEKVA